MVPFQDFRKAVSLVVLVIFAIGTTLAQECIITQNGICYYYMSEAADFRDAEDACEDDDAKLVTLTDSDTQGLLETLMEEEEVEDTWLGATLESEDPPVWRYISGCTTCANQDESHQRTVSYQGCFADRSGDRDLDRDVTDDVIGDMTPDSCAEACKEKSSRYTYAGVQGEEGEDFSCFCDDEFGKHGRTTGCNEDCPGTNPDNLRCGGEDKNAVYRIDGVYVKWGYNRPDNYEGHQTCAAIDVHRLEGKINDEACWQKYNYVCEIPLRKCESEESLEEDDRKFHYIDGDTKCIYVSDLSDTMALDWFEARAKCKNATFEGDLLTLDSEQVRVDAAGYMDASREEYWIGLTSRIWSWQSGEDITYSKWAEEQPGNSDDECVLVRQSDDFKWYSTSCDTELTYFCAKADESATTTETITTTATSTQTQTTDASRSTTAGTTTTTTPGQTTSEPADTTMDGIGPTNPEAVKSSDKLSTAEIILIVVCIILIIIIIVVIIVCCCCYKRSDSYNEGKVKPGYDARPDAPVPYAGYIGEEWGYGSETGSQANLVRGQHVPQRNSARGNYYNSRKVSTERF